ncbi:MAG: phosphatase PAP2 family protein [Sphingobacteriales bacterium]|nr:MAG: phosphatase PAP2 family protein [Sphingobacteriales bacterium]TAF79366.1 MAG: phosphatase PAP2 family protein [Sphingobacteriales bacterium]
MFQKIIGFLWVVLLYTSCNIDKQYQNKLNKPLLLRETVKKLNEVILDNNFTPPVASRNYAYATIAAYEAFSVANKNYQSLAGQLNGLSTLPKPDKNKSYDFEFSALIALCRVGNAVTFPAGSLDECVAQLTHLADSVGMPSEVLNNSLAWADTIANAVLKWSKNDKYLQSRSMPAYTVTNANGTWIPTPAAYASAVEPHWGQLRTMVLDSSKQFLPPPPYTFDIKNKNSAYHKEVQKLITVSKKLSNEQKHIALFWDDNPFKLNVIGHAMFSTKKFSPPGHWMNICGISSQQAKADFGTTLTGYTKTAIALYDAFIACWQAKYTYNTARPETVINKYFDKDWLPYIQTPPFPEYTAGHSTISAAAAETLSSVYGDNFAYTDNSEEAFGIKQRSYTSFRQAAAENILARFYGLIHFEYSCIEGNRCGVRIGNLVVKKLRMKVK